MKRDNKGRPFFMDLQGRVNHTFSVSEGDPNILSYENTIKNEAKRHNNPWPDQFTVKVFENEDGLFNNEYLQLYVDQLLEIENFRELCKDMHPHLLV